jgi:tetratricopeptide (TPR) repeat protein
MVWRAAILVAATVLAYSNSLSGPLIFDDGLAITDNVGIRDLSNLAAMVRSERELPTAGRPLVNVSFALNYAIGGVDVRGYHIVNIALHVVSGLLVFGIIRRTWSRASRDDVAFAASLLWLVHPLNTEAVNYLTQRTELMMALFLLLTLYASIRAWASGKLAWYAVSVLSCAAGMACKESMVTAPLLVVLYDVVFVFGSPRRAFAERWRFYALLGATLLLLPLLMLSGPRIHSAGFASGVSPWTYLLNQARLIARYIGLAFWPRSLVAVYGWPLPLTLADVWPSALFVAGLAVASAIALMRWPKAGFLGAWFFITLAPASSVVPIATEAGAERRMYLPLIALVVLVVAGLDALHRQKDSPSGPSSLRFHVLVAVIAVLLGVATYNRNLDYLSPVVLARTSVERFPTPVGYHYLANELIAAGDRAGGRAELQRALPQDTRAYYTLGVELLKDGDAQGAIEAFQTFLRENPTLLAAVSARQLLGQAFMKEQRWTEAIQQEEMALTMNPTDEQRTETYGVLVDACFSAEQYEQAVTYGRQYLARKPDDVRVISRVGVSLVALNRLEEAIDLFRLAARLSPTNADAHKNLANALSDHGDVAEALVAAERALALRPEDPATQALVEALR